MYDNNDLCCCFSSSAAPFPLVKTRPYTLHPHQGVLAVFHALRVFDPRFDPNLELFSKYSVGPQSASLAARIWALHATLHATLQGAAR